MSPADEARRRSLPALTLALGLALLGCAPRSGAPIGQGAVLVARDEAGATVTLRVDDVARDPADADGDVFLYELSVRNEEGAWRRYCAPDRDGRTLAVPLQGSWDASRRHVARDGVLTFGCTNGALAKCVRWGYKPWKSVNGVSLAEHHQACVRMTAADYCGDGLPHTRDGTPIDIFDRIGVQSPDPRPGMLFEAAWSPRGAVYLRKPRFGETLASVVAGCPDLLRDRTPLDAPDLDAQAVAARWPEALLFTESLQRTELP